ncbi:NADH-quinone oxidoreductase subunit J [bacterium]|nr:NADH-quinone oxidoreductase subunit J [bacterium]
MQLLSELIFWCFVVLTVGSAIVVVFHSRVIYSVFALLFTLFGVAALYVYLAADFLAASQLLIYVGGILTLIIFGVFLTSKVMSLNIAEQSHQRWLAVIPIVLVGAGLLMLILTTPWEIKISAVRPTTQELGQLLLTDYLVSFEAASILLLSALIGAMRLARFFRTED